ncbi:hypothetical protein ABW20_dc0106866 [Dactylellina cionopaga]|nr:hypothetical protein ABW20_dc0106866 [Dactylellina cionopaga]
MPSSQIPQDLLDEITSLNSIYAADTLTLQEPLSPSLTEADEADCILSPPSSEIYPPVSLTLRFPRDYPSSPPTILSGTTFGKGLSKEEVTQLSRDVLHNVWIDGVVVLFELVEGLKELLHTEPSAPTRDNNNHGDDSVIASATAAGEAEETNTSPSDSRQQLQVSETRVSVPVQEATSATPAVTVVSSIPWTITPATIIQKSVFVGRCVRVTCAETARSHISELIGTDRKVARATHNITGKA